MNKLYYFPPFLLNTPDTNPYSSDYKESLSHHFEVVEKDKKHKGFARIALLHKSFLADVYVFNWIESINNGIKNLPNFIASFLSLLFIIIRRKKIVWMLHNIHPHTGENFYSKTIQSFLYRNSTVIITHSREAQNYAKSRARCKVLFRCHPIKPFQCTGSKTAEKIDILIWGAILPYKGIKEFVLMPEVQKSSLVIKIVGRCNDEALERRILSGCNDRITFENRFAGQEELSVLCKNAKYVVFPYLTESVSSSGALIDTVAMGGTPVGPNVGAFKDLEREGVCITYRDKSDLVRLLSLSSIINEKAREKFIRNNSWKAFGQFVYDSLVSEQN